ncbi:MAG: type II toxin-antitoxin system mRNA interferase toxin, RelE/StbE family [bacterium]|nr:type II toxin-antitoxin system mRNA interferase toxin, RelE/StbE family [bacterium]
MEIFTTSLFRRKFKKLSPAIKREAEKKEEIFRSNPFDGKLRTHKLHGAYARFWAFSVTNTYRIMFEFSKESKVTFVDIDTHELYRDQ